jgi:uncharacterized protein YbjQ (UPF0145 family)
MIVTTTDTVPGREITECLGLVRGTTVRASSFVRNIGTIFRNAAGGEVPEYTKLVAEAREQALDRMIDEARVKGADAVVGFCFATSEVARSAAEIVAYGTAVRFTERA